KSYIYSPSDLITFMESEYVSWMDRFHLEFPDAAQPDEDKEEDRVVRTRGEEHERAFFKELAGAGHDILDLKGAKARSLWAASQASPISWCGRRAPPRSVTT